MNDLTEIKGEGWSIFRRDDRLVLKFKNGSDWPQHRLPPTIKTEPQIRRYVRMFLAAETAERKVQPFQPECPAEIRKDMTLRALAQLWVSGALVTLYPDHVRRKKSSRSDRGRFDKYILPLIGDRPLSDFEGVQGLELAELVMRRLPPPDQLSRDSRRQVAQILHRLFALAVYPLRLLNSNPLPRGWLPRGSAQKAKSYLYPEEDAKLLAKTKVPLLNRLFYGFLAREGLRSSEARGLLVSDVDLRNGVCNLDRNKTDDPRTWVLSPGVLEALQRYLERHRPEAKQDEPLFMDPGGRGPPSDNLGRALRRDLKTAGVKRAQLFTSSSERIHMRGHDLRATFVTINLANGKTETWISDRTGHKSSQMIARYRRMARTHAELNLGDLTPLASAIPELSATT